MSHYRRAQLAGGHIITFTVTYFFTVVTYRRQTFLCDDDVRVALRDAIQRVRERRRFHIDAWVLLPDHLHCIWTLSAGIVPFTGTMRISPRDGAASNATSRNDAANDYCGRNG